jgi:hypothetical protein
MQLPLRFPDRHEEMRRRCRAFQRLPADERVRAMLDTIASGFTLDQEAARDRRTGERRDDQRGHRQPSRVMPDLLEGAVRLCEAARRRNLPHALVGGLATGFRADSRFYRRIALLISVAPARLLVLLNDLKGRGFSGDAPRAVREWTQEHRTRLSFRGVEVNWLKPVIPMYRHVLDRATEETWLGHPVRVASADGLILMKLLANRPQDQFDIENLVAAHRDTLDLGWIRSEWATVAAADDPWMGRLLGLVASRGQGQ